MTRSVQGMNHQSFVSIAKKSDVVSLVRTPIALLATLGACVVDAKHFAVV